MKMIIGDDLTENYVDQTWVAVTVGADRRSSLLRSPSG
jgi:hypothetical protein